MFPFTFMIEPPPVPILPQHIDEGVGVRPGVLRAHAEHHWRPEHPAVDRHFPVVGAVIEGPGPAGARRPVRPVRVELNWNNIV